MAEPRLIMNDFLISLPFGLMVTQVHGKARFENLGETKAITVPKKNPLNSIECNCTKIKVVKFSDAFLPSESPVEPFLYIT